jgi:hypothetical protein
MVSSSRDFGVEQIFQANEFRAVDPSPLAALMPKVSRKIHNVIHNLYK